MPKLETIICDYLTKKYPQNVIVRIKSIKRHFVFGKLIDKILNIKKRDCFVIKLIKDNNSREDLIAIVKKHHSEDGPEYKILNKHWKNHYWKNRQYRIPEPIQWIPEHKILIMQKAEGVLLSQLLGFCMLPGINLFTKNYVHQMLALSMDWLIDFQTYTLKDKIFNFLDLYNEAIRKSKELSEEWEKFTKGLLDQINCNNIASLSIPQVDWHGDFLHRNIIIKESLVTVFDWEGHWKYETLHPLYEMYRFIFSLLLMNRRSAYNFKDIMKIASWTLRYYMQHSFVEIDYESCKHIYYLFLTDMIYNYDHQIGGLSVSKTNDNSELMHEITQVKFEDLLYEY